MLEEEPLEERALVRELDMGRLEMSAPVDNTLEEAKLENDEPGAEVLDDSSTPVVSESDADIFEDKDAEDEELVDPMEDAKVEEGKFVRG